MQKKSYWIWHFGDFEIYHSMLVNLRRQEYDADYPAFWKLSSPYVSVRFKKELECEEGSFTAYTNGKGYVMIDDVRYPIGVQVPVSKGRHTIVALISAQESFPALFVESDVCPSNGTWLCHHVAGEFEPVGFEECFDAVEKVPTVFPFEYEHKEPVSVEVRNDGLLYDFGTELFGYLNIKNASAEETMGVFYGESVEEALDTEYSIVRETVCGQSEYRLTQRAFRYVFIKTTAKCLDVSMEYEYLPLEQKGTFRCDNEKFNRIYDVCKHTFHLNCRESFLDGIKRDRWVWSGDAYQSARINNYLFADPAIVKRTAVGLVGRAPIEQHLNTIMDYSTLWIIGLYEYYMTYADLDFLQRIYPIAVELMAFCESRLNEDGFVVGKDDDWTFIDWSEIDKTGAVCAEQILMVQAYTTMAEIAKLLGCDAKDYAAKSAAMKARVNKFYWNDELGAFIDSYESGKKHVTRHANIFAVMYDIATPEQTESIVKNVLKNDAITKITTPYFEGYELDVLGKVGELHAIEDMLESYWGAMLDLGATTVWEEFDPTLSGAEHYAMYGYRYGKSLCHAWGAGPIYLFGRYYLGVYPTAPGYERFCVEPKLGGLKEINGTVPLGNDSVTISLDGKKLAVLATKDGGTLIWNGEKYPIEKNVLLTLNV